MTKVFVDIDEDQALARVARLLVTQPGIAVGATGGTLLVRIQRLLGVATSSRTVSPLWVAAVTLVMIVALMLTGPHAQSSAPGTLAPSDDEQQTILRGRVVDAGIIFPDPRAMEQPAIRPYDVLTPAGRL